LRDWKGRKLEAMQRAAEAAARAEIDAAAGIVAQPEAVAVSPIIAVEGPKPVATVSAKVFTPRAVQRKSGVVTPARSKSHNLHKARA
jgi:Tfp pilus assembly protein FimV